MCLCVATWFTHSEIHICDSGCILVLAPCLCLVCGLLCECPCVCVAVCVCVCARRAFGGVDANGNIMGHCSIHKSEYLRIEFVTICDWPYLGPRGADALRVKAW